MDNNKLNEFNKDFIEIECPICKQFCFCKPVDDDEMNDYKNGEHCFVCGWIYDYNQYLHPDLKNGKNVMSITEYKEWYKEQLIKDPSFDYFDKFITGEITPHSCPICGEYEFEHMFSYDICPVCGWEDDGCEIPYEGKEQIGSNRLTVSDYKKQFEEKRKKDSNYNWSKEQGLQFNK